MEDPDNEIGRRGARGFLNIGLRSDPINAEAWAILASIELFEGNCLEALKCSKRAYTLSNKDSRLAKNMKNYIDHLEKQIKNNEGCGVL